MKKMMKIFLTVVMTFAMVLGMSLSALADNTHTLTIKGTTVGKNIVAYRIFDATINGENRSYTLTDPFYNHFKTGDKDKLTVSAEIYDKIAGTGVTEDQRITFAKELLAEVIKNKSVYNNVEKEITATANETTVNELTSGYYLLYPVGATDIEKSPNTTPAMLVDVTSTKNEITMKSAYPTVEKTVDTDKKVTTAQIGDEVKFKLESYVPDMTGYTGYTYYFKDKLPAGLALPQKNGAIDYSKIIVKVGNTTLTRGATVVEGDYSVQTLNNNSFAIVFNRFYTKYKKSVGAKITVEYNAVVTENAVVGVSGGGNKNSATVTYSNDPTTGGKGKKGDGTTPDVPSDPQPKNSGENPEDPKVPDKGDLQDIPDDSTPSDSTVYTFDFELFKYHKVGETETLLKDAKFQLLDENKVVVNLKAKNNTEYIVQKTVNITDGIFTTVDAGNINIKGLKAGTYYLHETQAPDGYNRLDKDVKIVISAEVDASTKELKKAELSYAKDGETLGKATVYAEQTTPNVKVENKSGTILPNTGSTGTILFTIFGVAVLAFMMSTSVYSKKKNIN